VCTRKLFSEIVDVTHRGDFYEHILFLPFVFRGLVSLNN
jgi:hypothetical protein